MKATKHSRAHADDALRPFEPTRSEPFDRATVTAMLRRAALGHPPALLDRCLALGPVEAARALVRGEDPDEAERAVQAKRRAILSLESDDAASAWFWGRLMSTRHPLRAHMMLVWHDHFATSIRKVKSQHWMIQQVDAFERHGLGAFGDLLTSIAKGPAMLRWLDAESNRKGSANENFARELFELFALGRGNYEEKDIAEAARAFTGWRIARENFFFDRRRHDAGDKTVFGKRGAFGGDDILALAMAQSACPRFLADRLLRVFVGPKRPDTAVDALAAVLRENGLHVGRALEVLLASRLFHDRKLRATRVRGPAEWVLWILRTLELNASPLGVHRAAARMGQELLNPPDVSGWSGEQAWISSSTWLERANFAARLGQGNQPLFVRPYVDARVPGRDAVGELRWLSERLFPEGLTAEEQQRLERQVRSESRIDRPIRVAGTLRALLLLPRAHRF